MHLKILTVLLLILGVGLTVFIVNNSQSLSLRSKAAEPSKVKFYELRGPNSADFPTLNPSDPRFPQYPNDGRTVTSGLTKQEIEASKQFNEGVTTYQGDRPELPAGYSYVDAECSAYVQAADGLGCIDVSGDKNKNIPAVIWNNRGEVVNSYEDIPKSGSSSDSGLNAFLKNAGLPDFKTWFQNIQEPVNPESGISEGNNQTARTSPEDEQKDIGERIQDAINAMTNGAQAVFKWAVDTITPDPAPSGEIPPPPADPPPDGLNLQ